MDKATKVFSSLVGIGVSAIIVYGLGTIRGSQNMTPQSAYISKYGDGHSELRIIANDGTRNTLYCPPRTEGSFETIEAIKKREIELDNRLLRREQEKFLYKYQKGKISADSLSPTNWAYFTGRFPTNNSEKVGGGN